MEWILLKDETPNIGQECFFTDTSIRDMNIKDTNGKLIEGIVSNGWYSGNGKCKDYMDTRDSFTFTHWMPLPEPPNQK